MKPNSSKYDIPLTGNKELISEGQCESDESDDNENDDTARIVCNQLWRTYKGTVANLWYMWWLYVKMLPLKDIDGNYGFYCDKCS